MDSKWDAIALDDEPGPARNTGRWWRRTRARATRWTGLIAVVSVVTTLLAAAGGAAELRDMLHDGCRSIHACSPEPPPVLTGSLSELRIGAPHITLDEAYRERVPDAEPLPDGAWPGQFFTYRLEYQGTHGARCTVQWTLYDAISGRRLPEVVGVWETRHVPAFPDGGWTKEAGDVDANVGLIWVPYVQAGTFILEIELLNPAGALLDLERTEPFVVLAADLPA